MKATTRSMLAQSAGAAGPLLRLAAAEELHHLDWQDFALCAEIDPEIFFPEMGEPNQPAKKICRGCPVSEECLEYALSLDEDPDGIWGGWNQRERRRMRHAGTTSLPPVTVATEKYCADCGTTKPAGEFWKNSSASTGLSTYCRLHEVARRKQAA